MRALTSRPPTPVEAFRNWLRTDDSFHARILLAVVAGVGVVALLAVVFMVFEFRETTQTDLRERSITTLRMADQVASDLARLESAHRDYLETLDLRRHEILDQQRNELNERLAELTAQVAGDAQQAELVARLREDVTLWKIRMEESTLEKEQPFTQRRSFSLLERIRLNLAEFSHREEQQWQGANQRIDEERRWQGLGFAALSLAAIWLIIVCGRYGYRGAHRHVARVENAQSQLQLIVENTIDGLLTTDEDGAILLANPAAGSLFGVAPEELVGYRLIDIFPHGGFTTGAEELMIGLFETEARQLVSPFETFQVEISIARAELDGRREHVVIVRDITERLRSEETLRQIGLGVSSTTGEEFVQGLVTRLSLALDVSCAFIVEVEGEGDSSMHVITMAERGNICGAGPCDLAGTACEGVLHEGYQAYLGGVQGHFPCDWMVAAFAAESFVCMPLVDHLGRYVGLLGVLDQRELDRVDLIEATLQIFAARAAAEIERKRYAEWLAREKERLDVTLRSIGDACIAVDNYGRIALFNPVAEGLTGWSAEDVIGASLLDVLSLCNARTKRPLRKPIETLIQTGSASDIAGVALVIARDGSERVIETNASPLVDPQGEKTGAVLVLRDVTERHRNMEERQKAEKLESLGVAAGGIAHDFNNLLTAILGNLSLVLMGIKEDDAPYERLVAAKRASLRAQELAQQLLTFAKGGAPIKQTASIAQLLRETVVFHLRGSKVGCELDIPDDLWAAEIDAGQISQVIQNLTINADQAMPAGGTLTVTCANVELRHAGNSLGLSPGRYLKITVKDEGVGISQENLKKIFDPYFTTKPKGSGLGLATSYSIIKNHGGIIDVVSAPGAGSTFYVFLPATESVVAPVEEAPAPDGQPPTTARVLVLDDEEAICALVTCALEPYGYEVVEAFDAETAIEKYSAAL
ncbi:MAG TPA: PAS domain S-box protein, partial [Chthoniobacteraceae bacterium]|nr:PAS domain S-box protein [Chthoniobacteraceae bacterium]